MVAFQLSTANCIYVKCKKTQKKDWSTLLQSRSYRKEATVNHGAITLWQPLVSMVIIIYPSSRFLHFHFPFISPCWIGWLQNSPALEIKYNRVCRKIMKWVSLCSVTVFNIVLFFYKIRQVDDITIINLQTKWHTSLNTEHQTNTEHSTFVIF